MWKAICFPVTMAINWLLRVDWNTPRGDAVISMDGDLQHPPEMIPELISLWESGYEIVQTVRKATEDATFFKNITSSLYYKLINTMSEVRITPGGSDFRLMDRKAVDALNSYHERPVLFVEW